MQILKIGVEIKFSSRIYGEIKRLAKYKICNTSKESAEEAAEGERDKLEYKLRYTSLLRI